jgi:hypothetical protein
LWRWFAAKSHIELCTGKNKIKIFEGLSNNKNMVFNVKKLLSVGVGLMLRQKGGKNQCKRNEPADLCRQWLVFASTSVNADIYQELLRQHVVPRTKGHILMENTSLCRFSVRLHRKNHPAAIGGILVSGGLAAIFVRLVTALLR